MTARNLAFWLTERELDALFSLVVNPAAWPTFDRRTWKSLAAKGLISGPQDARGKRAPVLRGAAAESLTRALKSLTRANQREGQTNIALPGGEDALLAPARQNPLVLSEKVRPGLKS